MLSKNVSPLRYPGGKTRACKPLDIILNDCFKINEFKTIVSPFFGGGSFEFHMQHKYNLNIIANDKFTPLYNFWNTCKNDNSKLTTELYTYLNTIDKPKFAQLRSTIMDEQDIFKQSYMFFIINRCSFSGATLSGGFSSDASKKRFTKSSVDRVGKLDLSNVDLYNIDFEPFINQNEHEDNLMFLDPPYYLEKKSKLYGNNGDMHEYFDHQKLFDTISEKNNWIMTYNNCPYVRDLYEDFEIIEISWSYGMNASKKSSEIVIVG
jgi:DNA adenine methylase